jgi:Winged helix DNA-binding domain
VPNAQVGDVEGALYAERALVRMTAMRRTLFVVPAELVPVLQSACANRIAAQERRRLERLIEGARIARDGARWVAAVERDTLAAIAARGEATGAELSEAVPALRERMRFGEGKRWETTTAVTGRLLVVLAAEGRIVRGRPRGTWVSGQYRWTTAAAWLGGEIEALPPEHAEAELARRWLLAYGPAPASDLKWWTGWTVAQVRRAVAAIGAVEVSLGGSATGLALAGDLEPVAAPAPGPALLPSLDATVMGWAERSWFLGDHSALVFDRNGNAGPTVWWDGRVVGAWGQRRDGEIAFRLLEDVGAEAEAAISAEAERLRAWLGGTRFTPRFRTPLERELIV